MSRNLSLTTLRAIHGQETQEVFIVLLTIDHDDLVAPIRVCGNDVDMISRGESFLAYPFELKLPDDNDNQAPRAHLTIDNVGQQIIQTIRLIRSAPTVLIEIIRAADADIIEAQFPDFKFVNIQYNALTIQGDLTVENFTAEPFPAGQFTPSEFPSMF